MKKSLPGPRLTRRFGGFAAAFGGRGGFRLPGSNVRTVEKIVFFSVVMRSCSVACARSGRTACMCGHAHKAGSTALRTPNHPQVSSYKPTLPKERHAAPHTHRMERTPDGYYYILQQRAAFGGRLRLLPSAAARRLLRSAAAFGRFGCPCFRAKRSNFATWDVATPTSKTSLRRCASRRTVTSYCPDVPEAPCGPERRAALRLPARAARCSSIASVCVDAGVVPPRGAAELQAAMAVTFGLKCSTFFTFRPTGPAFVRQWATVLHTLASKISLGRCAPEDTLTSKTRNF